MDALARGEQIIILRKGGIAEGRGGFRIEHANFWLFPTLFHQQRESVIENARERYDIISRQFPVEGIVAIQFAAEVVSWRLLDSLEAANRLRGQHIWKDSVIAERFDWGRSKNIYTMALRVRRLPHTVLLPVLQGYGGCKSWVELEKDLPIDGAAPVLTDTDFASKSKAFEAVL